MRTRCRSGTCWSTPCGSPGMCRHEMPQPRPRPGCSRTRAGQPINRSRARTRARVITIQPMPLSQACNSGLALFVGPAHRWSRAGRFPRGSPRGNRLLTRRLDQCERHCRSVVGMLGALVLTTSTSASGHVLRARLRPAGDIRLFVASLQCLVETCQRIVKRRARSLLEC